MNETNMHMAAFFASLTNGSTNVAVAAVNDSVLSLVTTNNFILPAPGRLRMMYSAGVSLTNARVNTPSLRYVGLPNVGPVNLALAVPSPANLTDWGDMGPPLPTVDSISVEHTLGGGAPENEFSFLWFQFRQRQIVGGPTYRLRFTATITAAAGTWVNGSMTPDSTLPQGMYAIVGMDAIGTNLAGARLVIPGSTFRPGCLARNAAGNIARPEFTSGELGIWGTFNSVNIPTLDVFSIGANTAQTIFLDVVRTGDWKIQA